MVLRLDGLLQQGVAFTGVVRVQELGDTRSFVGKLVQAGTEVVVFLGQRTDFEGIDRLTLFRFSALYSQGRWKLIEEQDSRFLLHSRFRPHDLLRVREACAGLGALGQGGIPFGFEVKAQNELQPRTAEVAALVSKLAPIVGDISDESIVEALWDCCPGDAVLASGFACQPYSQLGDRRGSQDPRSDTLTGSLRAAYLLQSSALILECVPQAQDDVFVQSALAQFAEVTGFRLHQVVLHLHEVWTARRSRWWALLTTPQLGVSDLATWKPHGPWHSIEDAMDEFNATKEEAGQLQLQPFELQTFQELRPLDDYCLRRNQPLPTALHSWGSALTACPCGCRAHPLAWERLKKSGLCSVILPLETTHAEDSFRYPSASEVAYLTGLSPSLPMGNNSRLSLTLVGQMASPLQSAWVFGSLARQLGRLGVSFPNSLDGIQVLHTQRRMLLREAEAEGFRPVTAGSLLSGCPAICFETHGSILRKACPFPASSLPPCKKLRLDTDAAHRKALPSAPQRPQVGRVLWNSGRQAITATVLADLSSAQDRSEVPQVPLVGPLGFSPLTPPCQLGRRARTTAVPEDQSGATAAFASDRPEAPQVSPLGPLGFSPLFPPGPHVSTATTFANRPGAPSALAGDRSEAPIPLVGPLGFSPLASNAQTAEVPCLVEPCSMQQGSEASGHLRFEAGSSLQDSGTSNAEPTFPHSPMPVVGPLGFSPSRPGFSDVVVGFRPAEKQPFPADTSLSPPEKPEPADPAFSDQPGSLGASGDWVPLVVNTPGFLNQAVISTMGKEPLTSYLTCDEDGVVLPLGMPTCRGQRVRLWRPGLPLEAAPAQLNPRTLLFRGLAQILATVIPSSARAASLSRQGAVLADDQVAHSLGVIAGSCQNVLLLEPLLLLQCLGQEDPEPLRPFAAALYKGSSVISAVPLEGHWVTFAWDIPHGRFEAWDSCPVGLLDIEVSSVHRLWGKVMGLTGSGFFFRQGPWRPPAPGLCGHFALADLWSFLSAEPPLPHEEALSLAADFAAAFQLHLTRDSLVRAPLLLGAGANDLVEMGLASLLREKGVPAGQAADRAASAIARLGKGPIQTVMSSKLAWKNLKQLANNVSPPFQLVLHEELSQSVSSRANGQDPATRKNRQKPSKEPQTEAARPSLPPLDHIRVPDGVFASEGCPLCQMDLQSVGPQSVGVVLVSPAQAEPYLRLGQPVSQGALALVIVGDVDCANATVQVDKVRFRAELLNREPVLISGTLAQIGNKWVDKFVPQTTQVDIAESCVVRLAVYRDSCPVPWDSFIKAPLKEIVNLVPLLQTCDRAGCECQKWHGSADPGEPPAILETWSRQFVGNTFKPVPPSSATVFNIMLRLPVQLEVSIQAYSGTAGVYIEPRSDDTRSPSQRFTVIWLPRSSWQEALLLSQTHTAILGIARMGDRFGVRCLKKDEESLHRKLKPSTAWVDRARLRTFESGPWPFGTQKQSILKALVSFGWQNARPSQPCPGRRGGLWYKIEAEGEPPMQSLHAPFGEILFCELVAKTTPAAEVPQILASRRTLQGIQVPTDKSPARPPVDPLQASDPWQAALDRGPQPSHHGGTSSSSSDIAKVVEASVLQKLKASNTVSPQQEHLEQTLLARVDAKIAASHSDLEARVSSLDGRLGQLTHKVDSQEGVLQSLFAAQMSRIEELLGDTKRSRNE